MAGVTNQLTIIASLQDRLTRPLMGIEKSTGRLEKQFTKLSGAVQNAFQFYVRYRIFGLINQGISAIENAIPGLIARGQEWAQTVDTISDVTGLAAEKSSLLAGIAQTMTGDVNGLDRALGALANTTANHGDTLRRYGIDTRNANGELLDTWTILKNVRRATADMGNGFITTAAARELFSRGGQKLLDVLTMTDAQFKLLTRDVQESGVIMSDAGLRAAEAWQRTQQRFEMQVTGIANQITQGVQPLLTRLVDGITNYLRANMAQIVGFVTGVVSFVAGAIAGFLGIDITGTIKTMAEQLDAAAGSASKRDRALSRTAKTREEQTSSEDGYTNALNNQIDAIDRQLAAMAKADNAEDARREHARLLKDISDAKKELRDLRGEGIFAAGMSAAEAELARQAQAADIVDAQKRVREAQQKIAEQERDTARENRRLELQERKAMLQERLADHMKTIAAEGAADREVLSQIFGKDKGGLGSLPASLAKVGDEVRKGLLQADVGTKWGESFRAQLEGFFAGLNDPTTGLGASFASLVGVADMVRRNWQYVAGLGAILIAKNLAGSFLGLAGAIGPQSLLLVGIAALAITVMHTNEVLQQAYDDLHKKQESIKTMTPAQALAGLQNFAGGKGKGIFGGGESRPGHQLTDDVMRFLKLAPTVGLGEAESSVIRLARQVVSNQSTTTGQLRDASTALGTIVEKLRAEGSGERALTSVAVLQSALNTRLAIQTQQAANLNTAVSGLKTTVASALGPEGTMIAPLASVQRTSAQTQAYVGPSGGGTIAQHLSRIRANTAGLNTNVPWGIANVTLNIDGRTAMMMMGIPIRKGNSTTRISPTQ